MVEPRSFLRSLFDVAVAAADPARAVRAALPGHPRGRTVVVGAGKAAASMARAVDEGWDGPLSGVVVTRYGSGGACPRVEVLEAAHPVPDAAGLDAARRIAGAVSGLTADDLVIALISGGGSALLPAPAEGLTLEDEIAVTEALLSSGAPIRAMNAVRKQLSTIKGGRLAALAWPARVLTLIVSDVPGDDPALVASGPTVPDATTREDAIAAVRRYGMTLPPPVMDLLKSRRNGAPDPQDERFAANAVRVVASARRSLEAAAEEAARQGVGPAVLSDAVEGEAREVAHVHAAIAREVAGRGRPFPRPAVLLSGGETTVTIEGPGGKGGRNTEFLLSLALDLEGAAGVSALAADTDGIDGSEANAGAFADAGSAERMRDAGVDPAERLRTHDAFTAFQAIGDLFVTGPTGTNVNDFRAILVL